MIDRGFHVQIVTVMLLRLFTFQYRVKLIQIVSNVIHLRFSGWSFYIISVGIDPGDNGAARADPCSLQVYAIQLEQITSRDARLLIFAVYRFGIADPLLTHFDFFHGDIDPEIILRLDMMMFQVQVQLALTRLRRVSSYLIAQIIHQLIADHAVVVHARSVEHPVRFRWHSQQGNILIFPVRVFRFNR